MSKDAAVCFAIYFGFTHLVCVTKHDLFLAGRRSFFSKELAIAKPAKYIY